MCLASGNQRRSCYRYRKRASVTVTERQTTSSLVWGVGFVVCGLGFGVRGMGFGAWGLGLGAYGCGLGMGFLLWASRVTPSETRLVREGASEEGGREDGRVRVSGVRSEK